MRNIRDKLRIVSIVGLWTLDGPMIGYKSSKAFWHSAVHTKWFSGLSMSVNGRAILEKFKMKLLKKENSPIKDCNSLKLVGGVNSEPLLTSSC
jgi:hypothetical protein